MVEIGGDTMRSDPAIQKEGRASDLDLRERVLQLQRYLCDMRLEYQQYRVTFQKKLNRCNAMEANVLQNVTAEGTSLATNTKAESDDVMGIIEQRRNLAWWQEDLNKCEREILKGNKILKRKEGDTKEKEALLNKSVLNLEKTLKMIEDAYSTLRIHQDELEICIESIAHHNKAPETKLKDVIARKRSLLELNDRISTIRELVSEELVHMFSCKDDLCTIRNCKELRELKPHGSKSPCPDRQWCRHCENFEYLLKLHTFLCQAARCPVPTDQHVVPADTSRKSRPIVSERTQVDVEGSCKHSTWLV